MGTLLARPVGRNTQLRNIMELPVDLNYMYLAPKSGIDVLGAASSNYGFSQTASDASPTTSTWNEVVSVSGRGKISRFCHAVYNNSLAAVMDFRFEVDGRIVTEKSLSTSTTSYTASELGVIVGAQQPTAATGLVVAPFEIPFKSGFRFLVNPTSYTSLTVYAYFDHVFTKKVFA